MISLISGSLKDRIAGRELDAGERCFVDPHCKLVAALLYEGFLKIIPIDNTCFKEPYNVRLVDSRKLLDIQFLHGTPVPTLCGLFEDAQGNRFICTYTIDTKEKDLVDGPWKLSDVELGAKLVVPVPSPTNGIIVIGETSITYINYSNGKRIIQSISMQPIQVTTYGLIDLDGSRYLLGDLKGNLYVLVLVKDPSSGVVVSIAVDFVGVTNIAQTINYLDNGLVFIGSFYCDSQLVKLHDQPVVSSDNFVSIVDTHTNIGPILDMCFIESGKLGQSQIVTCSGSYHNGSLRVIKAGIGMQTQAALPLNGVKKIWSLRQSLDSEFDKYLVQSFTHETRVLVIEEEELSELESYCFETNVQTLLCLNAEQKLVVQVTQRSMRLIDTSSLSMVNEYTFPADKIATVACGGKNQIVIALSGGNVLYFIIDSTTQSLKLCSETLLDQDVACMTLRPVTGGGLSDLLVLGMWTDKSVRLVSLAGDMVETMRVVLTEEAQARDIVMCSLESAEDCYLFIGFGDGSMLSYQMSASNALANKRRVVLGTHPISFTYFHNCGTPCVFASSDHPTIIYSASNKLVFSMVNAESEVTSMAPFHSHLFANSIAVSSESTLAISVIDNLQKVHVKSHMLSETPRRIAYHKASSSYVLCTEKTVVNDAGVEETIYRILFLDENNFTTLHCEELDRFEQSLSITTMTFAGIAGTLGQRDCIVVGTAFVVPHELEPSRGRIYVYDIDPMDRTVSPVTRLDVNAAVFSLAPAQGRLVCGLGNKVQVFKLSSEGPMIDDMSDSIGQYSLDLECSHPGHIFVLYLKTQDNYILVGDLLRSVSLLKYNLSADGTGSLEEVARDYSSNSMRAIEIFPNNYDSYFLGAEDFGNFFSVKKPATDSDLLTTNETTVDGSKGAVEKKLSAHGEFHLGDLVNVFKKGSYTTHILDSTDNSNYSIGKESVLFGTISGAVGVILCIDDEAHRFFSAVERGVRSILGALGGLQHDEWRSFHTDRKSCPQKNFVDGDLVERLLDMDRPDVEAVVKFVGDELASAASKDLIIDTAATGAKATQENILAAHRPTLSVEECIARIDEISRRH